LVVLTRLDAKRRAGDLGTNLVNSLHLNLACRT
jgi:hypothetical protein